MHTRSPLQRRLLISFSSLLVLLLVAEVALRVLYADPAVLDAIRESPLQPSRNPALTYELRPGAEGRFWDSHVRINQDGFRDGDYTRERRPGVARIVALGDSITFGNKLEYEDTWCKQLEVLLAESGTPTEVLNLGVGGYDTRHEVEFLAQTGLVFEPDCVVVAYCINDLATVSVNLKKIAEMRHEPVGWLTHSHVAQWFAARLATTTEDEDHEESTAPDPNLEALRAELSTLLPRSASGEPAHHANDLRRLGWYTEPGRLERVGREFERLAELSREHGFEALVIVVPYLDEGPHDANARAWAQVYAMVRYEVERAGLQYVEGRSAFVGTELQTLRLRPEDMVHPNAAGHRLLAQLLLPVCEELLSR